MRIKLERFGFQDFSNEIFHICKLFYEDVELLEAKQEPQDNSEEAQPELVIRVLLIDRDHEPHPHRATEATATLLYADAQAAPIVRTVVRPLLGPDEESARRQRKRAIGAALLQALQTATGMEQPWGILTGVRPMKLLHKLMQEEPMEECRRVLREEYLLSEEKVELLASIGERQLKVIPDLFQLDREISLYIGIPFCPTKCAYCTFPAYDIRGSNGSVEAFLEGLHYEIEQTGEWLKRSGLGVTTLYWGGGTPTSIEAEQMDALFESLHRHIPGMDKLRELTVEAGRPDTITEDKINVMKKWKVDRISINPQSFTQATLDAIGRHHTVKETVEKFLLCRELGMNNINMDLILGLPNEGMQELELSLSETEKLMPESLTVHTLSFKRASRMTKDRESYEVAERDEVQEMMRATIEWTAAHDYHPYYMYRQKNILGNQENVGYSLPGYESLYNIVMMEDVQTIIGLGCGAVSKLVTRDGAIERFPNPKEPSVYNSAYREYTDKKLQLLDKLIP